jgi:hypothetical protein
MSSVVRWESRAAKGMNDVSATNISYFSSPSAFLRWSRFQPPAKAETIRVPKNIYDAGSTLASMCENANRATLHITGARVIFKIPGIASPLSIFSRTMADGLEMV